MSDGVAVEEQRGDELGEDMPASDFYLESGMTRAIKQPFVQCDESVVFVIALRESVSSVTAGGGHSTHLKSSGAWSPLVLVPIYSDKIPGPSLR